MIQLLAKDLKKCREFIEAFSKKNGTIYFSMMNLLEILSLDPDNVNFRHIRNFIDSVGSNFSIIDVVPMNVINREKGIVKGSLPPPVDEEFLKEIVLNQNGQSVSFSEFLDSLAQDKNLCVNIRAKKDTLKISIKKMIDDARAEFRRNPNAKKNVDSREFSPPKNGPPTEYIHKVLTNSLIRSNEEFLENDSVDYHHAVVTTAYSELIVLDNKWARRLQNLNLPASAATVYGISQKDDFLDRLKNW
jgi:hypothetical protein